MQQLCSLFGVHRSSYRAWHDRPKTLAPEERRLRERVKDTHTLGEAKQRITQYVIGYYSQFRRHAHNAGLTPNAAEQRCWSAYKPVVKMT